MTTFNPLPCASSDRSAHQRVRRAMYFAFAVIAALAVLQAIYVQRFERVRAGDAEIIAIAGMQGSFTQQVGRMAALAGSGAELTPLHADLLAEALDRSRSDALLVEALLAAQLRMSDASAPAVSAALAAWQQAQGRLWQRCELLLGHMAAGRLALLPEAVAAVQREADPALGAARALTDRLRQLADARSRQQLRLLQGGFVLTLLLLGVLALLVVEPTARSVRAQVQRLAAQAAELKRLALVAARTDNLVLVSDAERHIEWVNDAFTRTTGWRLDEIRGQRAMALLGTPNSDRATIARVEQALSAGEGVRVEMLNRTRDGIEFWIDADIQPLRGDDGVVRGYVTVGTDITERRRLQEQLRHSARTDALTGLPNRAVVVDRLQRAVAHAQRHPGYGFAVLFMDFDRFKQVNDTLGHAAGDELLREVARRIEQTLRPGDAVARVTSRLQTAARIGGDEFVVVLEGVHDAAEALTVAERLVEALGQPYTLRGQPVQSGVSVGLVVANQGQSGAEDLLRDADTAMYEAKRAGRGRCVVFDSSMHERVVHALEIETDLRRALRSDELFVVYQPVVDLGSEALLGVEALVRWRHPTRGVVSPAQFIGIAEEAGLIDAIGQLVLQMACRQFAAWRRDLGAQAPPLLAVNLSRAQLQLPGLVPEVKWLLDENGLQPGDLQLEVTESLAAQDARVLASLRELKALGVKLALDDFGTGYSSLACLHQLPVDTVKIDRSFVKDAESTEYHRVLIEATIRVAKALNMTTVAEGIETRGQMALMRTLRCDRGQGYLFSKPLAAAELEHWITRRALVSSDFDHGV